MGMMLELARKQPHKQFIFLSPQDMRYKKCVMEYYKACKYPARLYCMNGDKHTGLCSIAR